MEKSKDQKAARDLIVSSAHLALGSSPGLSELEYGSVLFSHAFNRWMVRCMAAAGVPSLSPVEILIIHSVRHRDRPKTLSDLCLVLDIEDTHVANYAVKKLDAAGLVKTGKSGKEKVVQVTDKGLEALTRYSEIRERLLVEATKVSGLSQGDLSDIASHLRALSGYYEQAARSAATL
ncbi:putative MarR family transcription regulator [Rhizobium sp. BK316]|uniref:winged helix DNA-binding protein n=1 Tax=Rhizobium sp. BK316 TaxID=2587053 RepID=UPI0016171D3C|nr:winged helix DNA-binding protein [Rhizobium sp. BK316]MBB3406850.1 putative MarR family transcription regulator [Rhizobium sp. BK316]